MFTFVLFHFYVTIDETTSINTINIYNILIIVLYYIYYQKNWSKPFCVRTYFHWNVFENKLISEFVTPFSKIHNWHNQWRKYNQFSRGIFCPSLILKSIYDRYYCVVYNRLSKMNAFFDRYIYVFKYIKIFNVKFVTIEVWRYKSCGYVRKYIM